MKKIYPGVLAGAVTAALAAALVQQPATAAMRADAPSQADPPVAAAHRPDNRPGPLTKRQDGLRQAAVARLVKGTARLRKQQGGGATVDLGSNTLVNFPAQRSDKILTILSEFGDGAGKKSGGTAGPLHNTIPEPDRAEDNSTIWRDDFDTAYYRDLFDGDGESMKNFYEELSSGRYTVTNGVEDWVTVPNNGAYYGANPHEDEGGAWDFINDTGDSWYADKVAELGSRAAVDDYLAQFDVWDRNDFDGDGNFNEPDGYIDHFQAIHAGEGEEAGASPDAIWSHRWYVYPGDYGTTGPSVDGSEDLQGGAQIGDSSYFIGDYTVEPENGGLGVFTHEFGHDLGLPDFYDTAGGDNGTGFWTLMSGGSWMSHGTETNDGIGYTPDNTGPDEKLALGWLDYSTVDPGESATVDLGPAAHTYDGEDQAAVVNLPDKTTATPYTTVPEGEHAWWSGRADNLNNTMTRSVGATKTATVTAQAWYDIEKDYDYLFAEFSTNDGATWTRAGAVTGTSRDRWKGLRFSYSPGGKPSLFRFRYSTDGGVNEAGAFLDAITTKTDDSTFSGGAENGANGWDAHGWKISTGTETDVTPRYYLMENRAYVGYDDTLSTGPYNFSEGVTRPNWVEYFPYQDGMLVWFADKAYADNNTSVHPGHGQALPVDARPTPFTYPDGTMPGNRRQPFDATFGLQATDAVCLHKETVAGHGKNATAVTSEACAPSSPGVATFDDTDPDAYWSSDNPLGSTKVAGTGVKATVTADGGNAMTVTITNPAAPTSP